MLRLIANASAVLVMTTRILKRLWTFHAARELLDLSRVPITAQRRPRSVRGVAFREHDERPRRHRPVLSNDQSSYGT